MWKEMLWLTGKNWKGDFLGYTLEDKMRYLPNRKWQWAMGESFFQSSEFDYQWTKIDCSVD